MNRSDGRRESCSRGLRGILLLLVVFATVEVRADPLRHVPDPRLPADSRLLPDSVRTPPPPSLVPPSPAPPPATGATKWTGGLHPAELGALGAATVADVVLFGLRNTFNEMQGRPRIENPGPDDLDRTISDALYRPGAGPLHGRFPDYLGQVIAPSLALVYYGTNAIVYWARGRSLINPASDETEYPAQPARMLWAVSEVIAYSGLLQEIANSVVSRDRPLYGLARPDYTEGAGGHVHMSFYSGHVSMAFGLASFASLNIGDFLTRQPLRNMHAVPRFLLARVLPTLTLYGLAAYVGVSRIVDQIHYFSDVAIGSVMGIALGNIIYLTHFGRPSSGILHGGRLVPMAPGGVAYVRTF